MATPDNSLDADERLALTKWHLEHNRLDRALLQIKPLLVGKPIEDDACLTGARLYAQLRLFERAQGLFSQYLKAHPDAYAVRFQLGMSQFENGDNPAALMTWEAVLSQQPHHPPCLFYSAVALLQNSDAGQAINLLQTILQKTPVDNLYYNQAKDLIAKLEQDPNYREKLRPDDEPALSTVAVKDVYSTEH